MMPFRLTALVLAAGLALSACQSSEEKAEARYQSGLSLLAKGDEDRAMVEFRNVFQLNGLHKEARRTYADLLLKRGQIGEAVGQYLRLVEQYPDEGVARRNLAELAVLRGDWDQVERQGREAIRLLPQDPSVKVVGLMLDYRAALLARDEAGKAAALTQARAMLADPATQAEEVQPGLPGAERLLRQLLISVALEAGDTATAMPLIDTALTKDPDNFSLNVIRLQALNKAGDTAGVGAQLKSMVTRFPDNAELRNSYISWLISQRDFAGAEAFLRAQAGAPTENPDSHVALIQLLYNTEGIDAARVETQALLEANQGTPSADLYGALLAGYEFEQGNRAAALQKIETILAKAQPSEQTRKIRLTQARMLATDGDLVGAQAQVETVLKEDPSNIDALKMRAAWRIQADDPGAAIVDLRKAQDQAPRDASIMTLLAEAHERDGAKDLAGEQLAKAVDASNRGVAESLRYATFLQRDGRTAAAMAVLSDARSANPNDPQILEALAQAYLVAKDWPNATGIAVALEGMGTSAASNAAKQLRAAILLGQGKTDEGLSYLSQLAPTDMMAGDGKSSPAEVQAALLMIQTLLQSGKTDEARSYLDGLQAKAPDDPYLMMISAGIDMVARQPEAAERKYRELIAKLPQSDGPVRQLYMLLSMQNRTDEARKVLDAGLAAIPESGGLLRLKAGDQEKAGDIDGAIASYEKIYEANTGDVVIANNLASLISTWRDDPASLERASAVARRLRGTTVPAFADTYGWISYRRGEYEEALPYLEAAAKGLPKDPIVQIHLGLTYAALNRTADARTALKAGIDLAGPTSTEGPVATAKKKLAELGDG